MEILLQLGANETAFIQFVLFIIAITFLTTVIFGPYFKAYDQRHKLTKGAEQVANDAQDEAKKLVQIYQLKAREINDKIKTIFEGSRQEAIVSTSVLIDTAKTQVAKTTETALSQIQTQKQNAGQQVKTISLDVSEAITKKLMGTV
ncbi:MAG: ATP synthase F0 subunit B [Bdellovibrio sp.]|nr:ATP synthase F0 subunit B [Bdellovibrio sp.]